MTFCVYNVIDPCPSHPVLSSAAGICKPSSSRFVCISAFLSYTVGKCCMECVQSFCRMSRECRQSLRLCRRYPPPPTPPLHCRPRKQVGKSAHAHGDVTWYKPIKAKGVANWYADKYPGSVLLKQPSSRPSSPLPSKFFVSARGTLSTHAVGSSVLK